MAFRTHYDAVPATRRALLERLAGCAATGLVQGFFVSDRLHRASEPSTQELAERVLAAVGEPVLSFTLATRDRAGVLDRVRTWRGAGVRSLLVVTGDHPEAAGGAGPHFDLDSMQTLMLLGEAGSRGDGFPADLHLGCVVSPFKRVEAELMWQYARLRRKVEAGAAFIVSQAGYDPRAWDELLRFCRLEGLATPAIGTVLVPDAGLARRIAAGKLPGVASPQRLLERLCSADARNALGLAAGTFGNLLSRPNAAEIQIVSIENRFEPYWMESFQPYCLRPPAGLHGPGQRRRGAGSHRAGTKVATQRNFQKRPLLYTERRGALH